MRTEVASASRRVTIDTAGPFVMIGEKINPTGRADLAAALRESNLDHVVDLAVSQVGMGADILDVNVGVPELDDVALLPEVIAAVSGAVDVPISIDSPNPDAIAAALEVCAGRPLVNSVNGESSSMDRILPLVGSHDAAVIALTLDENGIPDDAEGRLAIAARIIERAGSHGIGPERIVVDPLVLTVGADSDAARVTIETIRLVQGEFGVNINLGASNVSFGLPDRYTLNQTFLAMAIAAGASCAITDPAKSAMTVRAADLIRGRDDHGGRYIKQYRVQRREPEDG